MLISIANAAEDAAIEAATDAAVEAPGGFEQFLVSFGPLIALIFLFYLLLIRPQQRRMKDHHEMLTKLKKGDKVITGGGLIGTVAAVPPEDKDEVLVEIADGVKIMAVRSMLVDKKED